MRFMMIYTIYYTRDSPANPLAVELSNSGLEAPESEK